MTLERPDWHHITRDLVRALRGRRSQTALSRRLGFRSNVIYTWECGRREPGATDLFSLLRVVGIEVSAAWSSFSTEIDDLDLETKQGVSVLLSRLRGARKIRDIAEQCGVSRYVASRWMRGQTEPRVSEFLLVLETLTLRAHDFLASLVDSRRLPSLAPRWRELESRRDIAFNQPWSQAILRQLETTAYAGSKGDSVAWLAERLDISERTVQQAVGAMLVAGLIHVSGEGLGSRYSTRPIAVDTSLGSIAQRRELKLHWSRVAGERLAKEADGLFSWAVVGLSRSDFETLKSMHVDYLRALRQLVDQSEPTEVVALANVQLLEL